MLKKIRSLLYILSIGTIINSLHADSNYKSIHDNSNNRRKMPDLAQLLVDITDFFNQNSKFLSKEIPDSTPQSGDTFDFVVVGAGTAGATVAARLSEDPKFKVLLIEAGFHENLMLGIPVLAPMLQISNDANWNYPIQSYGNYCRGMVNNTCHFVTGKVVGGSSAINNMIATRGNSEDYNRWEKMGCKGWGYKDILKYFKKLEKLDIPELKSNTAYHGTNGPVHITKPLFHTPLADAYLKAAVEKGYSLVNYNGKNQIGFSRVQTTIKNGTRMSSNRAYLHPIHDRNNIYLTLESTVTKVLIDADTKRAIGVKFIKDGRKISVFANKEVILCAGAIKSPQLLMLSGIGPKKHLRELGINVVKDAPVGENLMDHLGFFGLSWTINSSISLKTSDLMNLNNPYISDFIINRKGPFTVPGSVEALGFVNTKFREKRSFTVGQSDIGLMLVSGTMKGSIFRSIVNLKNPLDSQYKEYENSDGFSIIVMLMKPKNRGKMTLLANDINVNPEIVPNYLDNRDDVRTMIAGIRSAIRLVQTKPLQAFGSQLINITYDECNDYEYDSDDYWECAIRIISSTLFHYSGTCKMGATGDPSAVVDPELKVNGVKDLRVIDASIFPEIPGSNINIPTIATAEKGVEMVLKKWGKKV